MKAAILECYDKNGTELVIKDIPLPELKEDEVLVKVHAAGVNPLDNMIIRGEVKLIVPYATPLVMGNEFVGEIVKTGSAVTGFEENERVFARMPLSSIGAFAEFVAIEQSALAHVPDYLSDEEAACVPLTALTAMQAFELMDAKPGNTLYISGGTGSVGAMAIPLAASRGFKVITSGNGDSKDRVEALGVSTFIDYHTQDYTQLLHDIDFVLDTLGDKALPGEFDILRENGTLVSLRGMPNRAFAKRMGLPFWKQLLFGIAGMKYDRMAKRKDQSYEFMFVHSDGAELAQAATMLEDRDVKPSINEVFPLDDVNAALARVANGKSKGKTILSIA